jgi:AcrR family transcriptional regulator
MHRKADILTTARNLFSERGYHGTSMRELAKSLDLKGATLYSHIHSKEEMLWEIVSLAADQFLTQARSVPSNIPAEEQLSLLVRGHLAVIARELDYATVFFHEWKFLEPPLRDRIRERRDQYEAYFRRVIDEGNRQGVFNVTDTRLATIFVLSALNWTYQWFHPAGSLSAEQLARQYNLLILHALRDGLVEQLPEY